MNELMNIQKILEITQGELILPESLKQDRFDINSIMINGASQLDIASESEIAIFAPSSPKMTARLMAQAKASKAPLLLVKTFQADLNKPQIVVKNPILAILRVLEVIKPCSQPKSEIHPTAVIHESAKVGDNVTIGAYSVIDKGVVIENDVTIFSHVVIYPGVIVKKGTTIHAGAIIREEVEIGEGSYIQNGAVIGSDGFGYVQDEKLGLVRLPHRGIVRLGKMVDIGANSTIDRSTLGATTIGDWTKLDNLVQIGHNCRIGKGVVMCAQVGVGGSSVIEDQVVLGGQTGIADHIHIVSGVRLGGQTGVTGDIQEKGDYAGYPHMPAKEWRRLQVYLGRIPELFKKLMSFSILALYLSSCAVDSADQSEQESSAKEDAVKISKEIELIETANSDFRDGFYTAARKNWQEAEEKYPSSKFQVYTNLKIADADYLAGNYYDASRAYGVFASMHPDHEAFTYARFMQAESMLRVLPSSTRDQSPY